MQPAASLVFTKLELRIEKVSDTMSLATSHFKPQIQHSFYEKLLTYKF